jgi:diguanylate cyclase (GGDEF)-like protein/PAS domain S-box-containing protein
MIAALAIALVGRQALAGRIAGRREVFVLAVLAAVDSVAGVLLLPASIRGSLSPDVLAVIATLTFVAIAGAGLIIAGSERRREVVRQNVIYRAIIDALPEPLHVKDLAGHFIAANPATAALIRVNKVEDLIGRDDFEFFPGETASRFDHDDDRLREEGKAFTLRQPVTFLDGSSGWLETLKAPLRDKDGKLIGFITHNRDITENVRLENEYVESQRRLAEALANMAYGLAMFDKDARILFCNPQYAALFPKTSELRRAGASLRDILRAGIAHGEETVPPGIVPEVWIERTCSDLRIGGDREIQLEGGRWLQARVRPSENGTSLTVVSEITAAKKAEVALQKMNLRLGALATIDGLTGLLNRGAFDEALSREFARSARVGEPISLLLIDVDWFKTYNDTYGHPQGDECLKAVAGTLRNTLKRPGDIAARYGGEEFVALLPGTDSSGAFLVAETFRQAVRTLNVPHSSSDKARVTVTVGVATVRDMSVTLPGDLVQRADEALYEGKTAGRDRTHRSQESDSRACAQSPYSHPYPFRRSGTWADTRNLLRRQGLAPRRR